MKIPRGITGEALAKSLKRAGNAQTRQTGSRIRPATETPSQHHVTVPCHDPLKVGTLVAILGDVAGHLRITKEKLAAKLFGRRA